MWSFSGFLCHLLYCFIYTGGLYNWSEKKNTRNVNISTWALENCRGHSRHYMANENFIQVGPHMMPYASERGDHDEQIMREKEGKMKMTGGESWKKHTEPQVSHTHKQKTALFQSLDKKRGRVACCGRTCTMHVLQCTISTLGHIILTVSLSLSISTSFSFRMWLSHSLPLIKYSQLVPLNIHRAAPLRLSALRQSASSECTRSPPRDWTHTQTSSACMACNVAALQRGVRREGWRERGRRKWPMRGKNKKKEGNDGWGRNETPERKLYEERKQKRL